MKRIKIMLLFLIISLICATEFKPISQRPFDVATSGVVSGRGIYMIVLPSESSEYYLTLESAGGDFVKLKKSNQTLKLELRDYSGDKKSFARETVLWGRKSGTMCLSIDYAGCNWRPLSNIDQELSTTKVKKFDDLHSFEKFKSL